MASASLTAVLRQAGKLAGQTPAHRLGDAELLERFTRAGDAAAFEALVARHGPLVWRVCRRVLGHEQDAEDAWQATFLVLARAARTVRAPAALAGWLHGVAFRLAEKARATAERRRARERAAAPRESVAPCQEAAWRELGRLLEEAVHALPEKYRAALLLCYWQGLTNDEAARRLGWAAGTVKARLAKARQLLHARLTAQGITLPAGAVALLLAPGAKAADALPPSLTAAAVRAAGAGAAGVSARATALAAEALKRVWPGRLKLVVAAVLALGAAGLGAGSLAPTPPGKPLAVLGPAADGRAAQPADTGRPAPRRDLYGDPLPPGAVVRLGTVRLRHGALIHDAAFSPDGKAVATRGNDGFTCVWDTATGKEVCRLRPSSYGSIALAYTAAGRAVALAGADGGFRLWDVQTGRPTGELMPVGKEAATGDLSPDGRLAVTLGRDGTVCVWDPVMGKQLRRVVTGHGSAVQDVQLSPDGRLLASRNRRDGAIHFHDVRTGALRYVIPGEDAASGKLAMSADGKWIAGVWRQRRILVWDAATGKLVRRLEPSPRDSIASVAFATDGKTLISGGDRVRFWEVDTGKLLRQLAPPPRSGWYVAASADGRTLATWGECELVLWDLAKARQHRAGRGHPGPVGALAVSPDGRLVATACFGDAARLWDAASGRELGSFRGSLREGTAGVAFSPDGRLLAVSDAESTVRLVKVNTGAEVRRLAVERPQDVLFSPDGKLLLTAGWDYVVRLWDPATGMGLRQVNLAALRGGGPGGYSLGVAFSPDGRLLATTDPGVMLWRVDDGKAWRRLSAGERESDGGPVAFSPDGRLVAARGGGRDNGTVQMWEVASGREVTALRGGAGCLTGIAFSPDGRLIATGSLGNPTGGVAGKLVVWELASGKQLARVEGHRGWLLTVAFTPDGRRLVTGATDTTALVWEVPELTRGAPAEAVRVASKEAGELWADLAGPDAARAWRAVWKLAAAPGHALPLLRKHLRPAPAPDAGRVARLLADLAGERFIARDRAARELEALGEAAAPLLRRALQAQPSLETRRRLKRILAQWDGPTPTQCIAVRATAVLEWIGNAEARRLLEELSGGAPAAELTRQARASLERLDRRKTAPR